MNFLIALLIPVAFADQFDPPVDFDAKDKAEWIASKCRWRATGSIHLDGYDDGNRIQTSDVCRRAASLAVIFFTQDPELAPDLDSKIVATAKFEMLFDDHAGRREVCQLKAKKSKFDQIDEAFAVAALKYDGPERARLDKILKENISAHCARVK